MKKAPGRMAGRFGGARALVGHWALGEGECRQAYITALMAAATAFRLPVLSAATQMRPESTP